MANLLRSPNIWTTKNLLSNRIFTTCIVNSLKNGSLNCQNCQNLQKSFTTISRVRATKLSPREVRQLHDEAQAFSKILKRSGFHGSRELKYLWESGSRCFSTSSRRQNEENNRNEENNQEKDEQKDKEIIRFMRFFIILSIYTLIYWTFSESSTRLKQTISWNEFVSDLLLKGEVDQISITPGSNTVLIKLHDGAIFKGKPVMFPIISMEVADTSRMEEKIRKIEQEMGVKVEDQVSISYRRAEAMNAMLSFLFISLMFVSLWYLGRGMKIMPTDMLGGIRRAKFVRVDIQSQQNKAKSIRFKDVAGLKEAKQEMLEFVDYLKTPDRYKALGAKIPRGAILLGPPGCGKTLLARAVATEAGVPFLAMAGSEFVEMIGGLGAARVRDLFKEAKAKAPCIVYLDEIDAIGRKRGRGPTSSSEEESTLNQLLVEMDGMETHKGVIMLASTNRADILDNALLRRGRFDRHITIDLPTMIERREIFDMYIKKLKTSTSAESLSPKLSQLSPGMSGADIANVCNEAAIHAARYSKKIIDPSDFQHALERIIAGATKKSKLLSPSEKKIVAYHESGHALVGWMLKYTDALLRISIVPRTNNALGFTQFLPQDKKLYSKQELFERMCMALGGRAAEVLIFNQTTTGGRDDLERVTKMAFDQIKSYGMNERIGPIAFPSEADDSVVGSKPYSKKLAAIIDEEARSLITHAFSKTVELLEENKDKLHKLSEVLLEKEALTYEEIKKLIGPPPFGEKNTTEPIGWEGELPSPDTVPSTKPGKDAEI